MKKYKNFEQDNKIKWKIQSTNVAKIKDIKIWCHNTFSYIGLIDLFEGLGINRPIFYIRLEEVWIDHFDGIQHPLRGIFDHAVPEGLVAEALILDHVMVKGHAPYFEDIFIWCIRGSILSLQFEPILL